MNYLKFKKQKPSMEVVCISAWTNGYNLLNFDMGDLFKKTTGKFLVILAHNEVSQLQETLLVRININHNM